MKLWIEPFSVLRVLVPTMGDQIGGMDADPPGDVDPAAILLQILSNPNGLNELTSTFQRNPALASIVLDRLIGLLGSDVNSQAEAASVSIFL